MAATYCMSGQGIKALIMSVTGTVGSSFPDPSTD